VLRMSSPSILPFLLLLVSCRAGGLATPATPTEPAPMALDSTLERIRAAHETPALAAAVVSRGGVIASGAAGTRYRGSPAPVSVRDRFHVGSNAKAMTATMIATLVDDGRLQWTSTVAGVFPELVDSLDAGFHDATLEQLLAHRAGVIAFTSPLEFGAAGEMSGPPMEQRRLLTARLLRRPPLAAPGDSFHYSNAGYSIAAAMAERVTGQAWEDLMQERLFRPMGITTAGYGWPAAADTTQPRGHLPLTPGPPAPQPLDHPYRLPAYLAPAGDVYLSIEDYARFVQANLQGLGEGHPLLRPESWRRLHTAIGGYALGGGVNTHAERGVQSLHAGSAGTFFAQVLLLQERDLALFVVANAADPRTQQAIAETVGVLLRRHGFGTPPNAGQAQ
jgi:CubicO group peptidase (beta-lactamase class C family)